MSETPVPSVAETPGTAFDFSITLLNGQPLALDTLRGKVLLLVNTASRCGFTPQYEGLQTLHESFGGRGLVVIGFPCNQFGAQELGSADEIASFCRNNYQVSFLLSEKIDVNGDHAHPLWAWLTRSVPGLLGTEAIKWNFTKFLIGRDGLAKDRYAPQTRPLDLVDAIEAQLLKSAPER